MGASVTGNGGNLSGKEINKLIIYRGDQLAGHLYRTIKGCEFKFAQNFLENPHYENLSYHIKKQDRAYEYQGVNLPPFFAGLLPEGLRLKTFIQKIKTSEDDLFSILASIGNSCVGDVYPYNKKVIKGKVPSFSEINFYDLFSQIMDKNEIFENDETIPGVQEKISASMISFPLNITRKNKSYILKLNPKDKPRLVENEYLSLEIAKKCGLAVNKAKLVEDKSNNKALLVERFDRVVVKDKKIMIHQEDGCQFLDLYPADKYIVSFKNLCSGIQEFSTAPKIEIQKALQVYAFSYLIGNGDLHAKNISLQTHPNSQIVKLSPCYDLICTYIYEDEIMALKLNGKDKNIKRKEFVSFAESFNIPKKSIELMLDKLIKSFDKNNFLLKSIMTKEEEKKYTEMAERRLKDLS